MQQSETKGEEYLKKHHEAVMSRGCQILWRDTHNHEDTRVVGDYVVDKMEKQTHYRKQAPLTKCTTKFSIGPKL